jgi:SMODS-associated and fused to various effectors sensor domain
VRRRRTGANDVCVALVLSLSGTIDDRLLPSEIDADYSVYEITLQDRTPDPGFLNRREDLDNFRLTYRRFLAELMRDHPGIKELHVFPAVPAPVAVTCGHDLLPKVQPTLAVYDYDRMSGGFNNRLRINSHDAN